MKIRKNAKTVRNVDVWPFEGPPINKTDSVMEREWKKLNTLHEHFIESGGETFQQAITGAMLFSLLEKFNELKKEADNMSSRIRRLLEQ